MAKPIIDNMNGVPAVQSASFYLTHQGLVDADALVDAEGNVFTASRFMDDNFTRVYVQKVAPSGVRVGHWQVVGGHGWKLDGMGLSASGADLLVSTVGHDLPNPPPPEGRLSSYAIARIPGVFVPFGNQLPKAGAEGAFVPQIQEGEPVDYEEVQRRAKAALDEWLDSWIAEGEGTRQTLKNMTADSTLHLMRPAVDGDKNAWKAREWNDRTFDREKNAAANPWANVLGGLDPWGVARRDELKQIIREVLDEREGQLLAELDTTEEQES